MKAPAYRPGAPTRYEAHTPYSTPAAEELALRTAREREAKALAADPKKRDRMVEQIQLLHRAAAGGLDAAQASYFHAIEHLHPDLVAEVILRALVEQGVEGDDLRTELARLESTPSLQVLS